MTYHHLSLQERIDLQFAQLLGLGVRATARLLGRDPGTISRELKRNRPVLGAEYQASTAQQQATWRHMACRPRKKLEPGDELFDLVVEMLRERFSPEQIAGKLRTMYPDIHANYVCRETIYNAVYALPVGELRKELILSLIHI